MKSKEYLEMNQQHPILLFSIDTRSFALFLCNASVMGIWLLGYFSLVDIVFFSKINLRGQYSLPDRRQGILQHSIT